MASSSEIKTWINEVKVGKPFSPESILIRKDVAGHTHITLLDIACCTQSLKIEKAAGDVDKQDIEAIKSLINHKH